MRFLIPLIFCLIAGPAFAQETAAPPPAAGDSVATPANTDGPPLPRSRPEDLGTPLPEPEAAAESAAEADTPADSPSPEAAPEGEEGVAEAVPDAEEGDVPLPRPRPDAAAPDAEPRDTGSGEIPADEVVQQYAEPEVTAPPRVYQTACPAMMLGRVEAKMLAPIADGACGTQSPLSVTAVSANGRMIPLSSAAITDCGMASALPVWVEAVDSWLIGRENTRLKEIIISTSYMCRRVNNAKTGNLSFHAFADALDIMGFRLEDGRTVMIDGGWSDPDAFEGRFLRYAHGAACSSFTTVLGPEANALHGDHFHIDLGCHGKRCTARICE
ncbi:extensin family protein [Devosia sp.]|uniref:extensin-like domain-containing protein n=1 Tax=Devosia sp. TaxID=1871048 RepID=UPI003A9260F4